MYLKIKCVNHQLLDSFKDNMKEYLGLDQIQSYFPIFEDYFNVYNFSDSHQNYVLDSRYKICNILCEPDETVAATLYDSQNKEYIQKKIFIKENPILEPTHSMQNRYRIDSRNSLLPYSESYSSRTFKKIGLKNNSTYIDSFFVFVASLLTEKNILPSFPLYYGSYCCISEEYLYNITEEYQSFKKEGWFLKNNNKLFEIERSDGLDDSDLDIGIEMINSNILKDNNNNSKNNLLEVKLSDINGEIDIKDLFNNNSDSDDLSEFDFNSDELETSIYAKFQDYPTQVIFMEELDGTLEDIMISDSNEEIKSEFDSNFNQLSIYMKIWRKRYTKHICYNKWVSILFQVCFTLAFLQKNFQFTHNDLHCDNVMYTKTNKKYLYYRIDDQYYKIPTFGMIIKIIDFGRSIYKINNKQYFSDVFKHDSDAGGQYTYPFPKSKSKNHNVHKPNYSFDLCRLSTTIINELYPEEHSEYYQNIMLYKLLKQWITDKYNKNVMRFDDFDLYKIIARRMNNAIPLKSINNPIFNRYKYSSSCIINEQKHNSDNIIVYKLITKKL